MPMGGHRDPSKNIAKPKPPRRLLSGLSGKANVGTSPTPRDTVSHNAGYFQRASAVTKQPSPIKKPSNYWPDFWDDYDRYQAGKSVNTQDNRTKGLLASLMPSSLNSTMPVGRTSTYRPRLIPGFMPGNLNHLMMPIEGTEFSDVAGDYGPRVHPIDGGLRQHTGADISSPTGTPVYAASSGVVGDATSWGDAYGNRVLVNHGKGYETRYGHLSQTAVKPGQKVKKGDIIGYVGTTGYSTGPHLHFETWQDGHTADPANFLEHARNTVPKGGAGVRPTESQFEGVDVNQLTQNMEFNSDGSIDFTAALAKQLDKKSPQQNGSKPQGSGNAQLDAFLKAISTQESGDNYGAVGVQTGSGRAYGKYQILDSNFVGPGGWDSDTIGREVTLSEYLNSPEVQEGIAQGKLSEYFNKYGPAGAAKAWYAGPGNWDSNSDSPQYGGPSINDYAASVLAHMQKYLR